MMDANGMIEAIIFGGDGSGASTIEELTTSGGTSDAGKVLAVKNDGSIGAVTLPVSEGTVAIDTTLAITGAAPDSAVVGQRFDEVNESLRAVEIATGQGVLLDKTPVTTKRYWNSTGERTSSETWNTTPLVNIENYTKLTMSGYKYTGSAVYFVYFSSNDETDVLSTVSLTGNALTTAIEHTVPDGAKYVSFSVQGTYLSNFAAYGSTDADFATTEELSALDTRVTALEAEDTDKMLSLFEYGYRALDASWETGAWTGVNEKHAYSYIARTTEGIYFAEDTLVKCDEGFKVSGYIVYADTTSEKLSAYNCSYMYPAGSTGYINVSRITVDTTETSDAETWGAKLKVISGRMTDYWRYRESFFGIDCFESIGFIGDSYTAGRDGHTWGACLARQVGASYQIFAKSGISSSGWRSDETYGLPKLITSDACELYWINLGINDASRYKSDSTYLGSLADLDGLTYDSYPDTFYGNYCCAIESIMAYAPNAKIVLEKAMFANPFQNYKASDTTDIPSINNAIDEIAEHYQLPVMDMLDDVFYWSREWKEGILSNHPDIYMYPGMACANRRLFSKCVREYRDYFAEWLV